MEFKPRFFLNDISEKSDDFELIGCLHTRVTNITAIEDIPLYLAVNNFYSARLKIVQKILLNDNDDYEFNEIATFYPYWSYTSTFIKIFNDNDNMNYYRFFMDFKNDYQRNTINIMIYICMNKDYLSKIIERKIRIPKLLVLYFRESHNYDPQLVTPVKNIHNINLTKEYKRNLFNYQKNNVKWMMDIENKIDKKNNTVSLLHLRKNHLYFKLMGHDVVCNTDERRVIDPDILEYREYDTIGGILADDVGLGKSLSMISLINESYKNDSLPTLIICPKRLCVQWKEEINKSCDLNTFMISNISQFKKIKKDNVDDYAIYIVPNNLFLNKNYKKYVEENPDDFSIRNMFWERVILDEGHEYYLNTLKNTLEMRHYIHNIESKYRWICTGTLFNDFKIDFEMYNYISRMDVSDWTTTTFKNNQKLISELYHNFCRKNIKDNVNNEVVIPEPIFDTEFLTQTEKEKIIYDSALGDTKKMIELCNHIQVSDEHITILGNKPLTLTEIHEKMTSYYNDKIKKYSSKILRLEETLSKTDDENINDDLNEKITDYKLTLNTYKSKYSIFNNIEERMETEETCPICLEEFGDLTKSITQCGHVMCARCTQHLFKNHTYASCPLCRNQIFKNKIQIVKNIEKTPDNLTNVEKWGTKMARMVEYLSDLLTDKTSRIIIFSKWDNMLRIIEEILVDCGIKYTYINGSVFTINKKINTFKTSDSIRVALLSSDKSASGINITESNYIILLDTLSDNEHSAKIIEDQAIGRSVRIGQQKQVYVKRFIMKDTIEHDYYNKMFNK